MNGASSTRAQFDRVQRIALASGAIGLALCGAFAIRSGTQFFRSYLFAYAFWLTIPTGCMAILMLHHLTGGWWGYPIRRLLEAGTRTFVWMAVLFLPVLHEESTQTTNQAAHENYCRKIRMLASHRL